MSGGWEAEGNEDNADGNREGGGGGGGGGG